MEYKEGSKRFDIYSLYDLTVWETAWIDLFVRIIKWYRVSRRTDIILTEILCVKTN